jgi:hypothetical protein
MTHTAENDPCSRGSRGGTMAGCPRRNSCRSNLRDAQILARHSDPRTTEHYDRARGNLDRHGVHFLTAYVAGV